MGLLIALVIGAALAVALISMGKKIGLALVILTLAVAMYWRDNISVWEWVIFAIIFIYGLIKTCLGGRRIGTGLVVLVITAILATQFSFYDTIIKTPIAWAASVAPNVDLNPFGPDRDELIKALDDDIKGEHDSANARLDAIEQKNREQDEQLANHARRIDALEKNMHTVTAKISALEKKVTGTVATTLPTDLTKEQIASALTADLVDMGINPEDVTFFTINWDKNEYDIGDNPFTDRMIDSQEKLFRHNNGSADKSKATRAHILTALPEPQERRALSATGHVPMQFHKQLCLEGNTYYDDAKKKAIRGGIRCHEAGDVIWVYVGSDGKVYWDASVRADCGNPGMTAPPRLTKEKPKKPGTPGTPGTPNKTTPPKSTPTPSQTTPGSTSTPTPTPSKSTPTRTPTPTPTPSQTCPPNTEGKYCKPKASAPPPPGQSPRPSGTTTAAPRPSPTHTGPTLQPSPTVSATRPPSDGHTPQPSSTPVLPSPTASGTVGDG